VVGGGACQGVAELRMSMYSHTPYIHPVKVRSGRLLGPDPLLLARYFKPAPPPSQPSLHSLCTTGGGFHPSLPGLRSHGLVGGGGCKNTRRSRIPVTRGTDGGSQGGHRGLHPRSWVLQKYDDLVHEIVEASPNKYAVKVKKSMSQNDFFGLA
jgi:hypothetical protein